MSLSEIINTVADFFQVSPGEIRGRSRKKRIVKARHVACYLARQISQESYPVIGRELQKRNHTTILNACRKISLEISKKENLKKEVDILISIIKENRKNYEIPVIISNNEENYKEKNKKYINKLPLKYFSTEQLSRVETIIEKYRLGHTLAVVGKEFKVTRERIRQIIMAGLEYEAQVKFGLSREIEIAEFVAKEKRNHLLKKENKKEKKEIIIKEKRWSQNYDHCRKCGRNTIKHRSNGFCIWCYSKTDIFKKQQKESFLRNKKRRTIKQREYSKEYSKRPEVIEKSRLRDDIKRFGGNREKALMRDQYQCQKCYMTKEESLRKLGRDLYVYHVNHTKDNRLENLATLCQKCFNEKSVRLMREKIGKRNRYKM